MEKNKLFDELSYSFTIVDELEDFSSSLLREALLLIELCFDDKKPAFCTRYRLNKHIFRIIIENICNLYKYYISPPTPSAESLSENFDTTLCAEVFENVLNNIRKEVEKLHEEKTKSSDSSTPSTSSQSSSS